MKRLPVGRMILAMLCCLLVIVLVTQFAAVDETATEGDKPAYVAPAQQAAIDSLQAALPIQYKTDDDGRVILLVARGPQMTDAVAAQLAGLTELQDVQLEGGTLGTEGLRTIASLPHLQSLRLEKAELTAEAVHALAPADNLRQLFLADSTVNDDAVDTIGKLVGLELPISPELR